LEKDTIVKATAVKELILILSIFQGLNHQLWLLEQFLSKTTTCFKSELLWVL